jgi:hypothetical protein
VGFLDFLERAMGLRALRRAPALSLKMPNSIGIFDARFSSHSDSIFEKKILHFRGELFFKLERAMGLEPTTAAMARRYSSQLSYARGLLVREAFYGFLWKIKFFQKEQNTLDSCLRRNDRNERIFCIIPSFLYNRFDF